MQQTAVTPRAATAQASQASQASQAAQEARRELIFKRDELRDQLKELASRRNQLLEQRHGLPPGPAAEINARIAIIDKRSAQLETQLFATNDAIANGFGGPVVSEAEVQAQLADAQAGLSQQQVGSIQHVVNSAVEDAVFGSFAAATTTLLAFYVVWRGIRRFIWKPKRVAGLPDHSAQMEKLQQSMDVIAIEVERISEAQRFTAKLLNDRGLGAGEGQPIAASQREAARAR